MRSWFRKILAPHPVPPHDVVPVYHWAENEIPSYPPFMKGLPVVTPEQLLERPQQRDLIKQIRDVAVTSDEEFERFYMAAIRRFTAFAHLLPASQAHHHRGAGGLLNHSLQVGLWTLRLADKVLLSCAETPRQRRDMEPRWHLAAFLAALCHDAGKPETDLVVTNRDRSSQWTPLSQSLYDWAKENKVDAYFIDWREGRGKQHTEFSALLAANIIGQDALMWIREANRDFIAWITGSLSCNPSATNLIYDLMVKADQMSVEHDLRTIGTAMAGYDIGVPVERYLTDIMRRLIQENVWFVNEPSARLWKIDGNCYLVWPKAGEELAKAVRDDGVPGIPRSPDGILDMLTDRGLAFVREVDEGDVGDRYWQIAPACLTEKIPSLRLSAIRLKDDALVSSMPLPSVDGAVYAGKENLNPEKTASATIMAPPAPVMAVPEAIPDTMISQPGESGTLPAGTTQHSGAGRIEPSMSPVVSESSLPPVASATKSAPTSKSAPAMAVPPRDAGAAVEMEGAIGEALKAVAEDLASGDKAWGDVALLDDTRRLLLKWPDAFSGYGLTSGFILGELSSRSWLWVDPMAPLVKTRDVAFTNGQAKSIRLERPISEAFLQTSGEPGALPQAPPVAPKQDAHRPVEPQLPDEGNAGWEVLPVTLPCEADCSIADPMPMYELAPALQSCTNNPKHPREEAMAVDGEGEQEAARKKRNRKKHKPVSEVCGENDPHQAPPRASKIEPPASDRQRVASRAPSDKAVPAPANDAHAVPADSERTVAAELDTKTEIADLDALVGLVVTAFGTQTAAGEWIEVKKPDLLRAVSAAGLSISRRRLKNFVDSAPERVVDGGFMLRFRHSE